MPYDWNDPRDPKDAFDRFSREAEHWPTPDDDESESRVRRPVTDEEMFCFVTSGGKIKYCPTTYPKPRRRPLQSKARKRFLLQRAMEFDPLAGVPDAEHVLKEHFGIIKAASRRSHQKWERIRGIIKAALEGWTQADIAKEWNLDPAIISRLLRDAYKDYPNLQRPLKQLNLLNLQAKRRELSSSLACALQWGDGNFEQEEPLLGPSPYADKPNSVKLLELHQRVFPQLGSNFDAMINEMVRETVDVGTQRVLRAAKGWDKGYDEADRTDYRARLSSDVYDDDAMDTWLRLRRSIGCTASFQEFIVAYGGYPLEEHLAWFFDKEGLRRVTTDSLPTRVEQPKKARDKPPSTPWSQSWQSPFVGAPSSNHGYLGPIGRSVSHPTPAPVSTNYYTKGFRIPMKLLPLSKLRGKGQRSKRFATAVLNHGVPNVNTELRKQFPEPIPSRLSAHDWKQHLTRLSEAKWSKHPMCNAVRHVKLPNVRADEIVSGWPILAPSMHQDGAVLFEHQVTAG